MEEEKTGEIRLPSADESGLFIQEAESLRLQGSHEEAIGRCREGLNRAPDSLPGRLLLGRCLLESGKITEARKELEAVARGVEECLPVYKLLSRVYLEEKDVEKALEVLRKTLYFPGAEESTGKKVTPLEMDLLHRGPRPPFAAPPPFRKPGAPPESGSPEEERPAKPVIQTDTLAEIFIKQGHPDRALQVYEDILAGDPHNSAVRGKYEALKKELGKDPKGQFREKTRAQLHKWLEAVSRKTDPEPGG